MHLFVVREPGLDAFAHVHPTRVDSATFEAPLPPLPAGRYRVYADIVHESGFPRTLVAAAELSAPPAAHSGTLPDSLGGGARAGAAGDDAWLVSPAGAATLAGAGGRAALGDGATVALLADSALASGRETTLRFAVRDAAGAPAALEPYMGMAGHLMVTNADGSVFVHLHPNGTISMAARDRLLRRERGDTVMHGADQPVDSAAPVAHAAHGASPPVAFSGDVPFPFAFPKPGAYRLWLQVRQGGRVRTSAFDVTVR
jgi:hypothetical protein